MATDSAKTIGYANYTLTVAPPTISITTATIKSATAGKSYSQSFTATGGKAPYTYVVSGLPTGIALSGSALKGTPTVAGRFPIKVTTTDCYGFTGTASYALVVNSPVIKLSPANTTLATVVAGKTCNKKFSASGGTAPYTYSETGSLPNGLTMTGGVLSGVPTVAGTFSVAVTVYDSNKFSCSGDYTLTVNAPTIKLSPGSLPAAKKGHDYNGTFTASGGAAPYTYTETGDLPDGLTFSDGTLSGTATSSGSCSFTVTVTDANKFSVTKSYSLTVK
jgi:hypothetical protein